MFKNRLRELRRDVRAAGVLVATGCRLLVTTLLSALGLGKRQGESGGTHGAAPLFGAVATRDTDQLRSLLAAGADPNARHPAGPSLLEAAVRERAVESVEVLLAYGADPEATIDGQDSALAIAAFRNQRPSATLLLAAGACPLTANPGPLGGSPLSLAVTGGYERLSQVMLEYADLDANTLSELAAMAPTTAGDGLVKTLLQARTERASDEPAA